jgi:hypothetical protein
MKRPLRKISAAWRPLLVLLAVALGVSMVQDMLEPTQEYAQVVRPYDPLP